MKGRIAMSGIKRLISLCLSLTMIMGLITITSVSAADADIIYETFDADFVIDNANKTITTGTEGLTATAHDKIFAKGTMAVTDNGLFVPAGISDEDKKGVDFKFAPITEGVTEISFDLNVTAVGSSHSSTLGQLTGTQADGVTVKSANISFNSPAQRSVGGYNVFFYGKLIAAQGEKFRATYIIDYTANKIETLVNGVSIDIRNIQNSVTSIDTLKFFDGYNPDAYYIDNLTIVRNADENQKTITFAGVDGIAPITTTAGREVTLPIPEVTGKIFGGWKDTNGNHVDNNYIVLGDVTLTADLRDLIAVKEDFTDSDTLTTTDKFTYDATSSDSPACWVVTSEGTLKYDASKCGTGIHNETMLVSFPEIREGKATVSYRLKVTQFPTASWSASAHFGSLGNIMNGYYLRADSSSKFYGFSNTNVGSATASPQKLNSDTAWHDIAYNIDIDNGVWEFYFDGVKAAEGTTKAGEVLSTIKFYVYAYGTGSVHNYWMQIDDLTVIENPEAQKKTITFMDGTDVVEAKTVEVFGTVTAPEAPIKDGKIFTGWKTADGADVTDAMLENITADATYYATYRGRIVLKETFSNPNVLTDGSSPFTITVTDTKSTNSVKISESGTMLFDVNSKGDICEATVNMTFDEITEGKAEVSFRLKMNGRRGSWESNAQVGKLVGIVDKFVFSQANDNLWFSTGNNGTELGLVSNKDWHNVKYVVDKTAGTYEFYFDGVKKAEGDLIADGKLNTISFYRKWHTNNRYDFEIDDVTVIENPVEISDSITDEVDGTDMPERVLAEGETVKINEGAILKNATINATKGAVEMGKATLTGRITFNEKGEIDAAVGDTVKVMATDYSYEVDGNQYTGKDGSAQGFIQKFPITKASQSYTMTLTAVSDNENYNGRTKTIVFDKIGGIFEGDARFMALVVGVPEGVSIEAAYGKVE